MEGAAFEEASTTALFDATSWLAPVVHGNAGDHRPQRHSVDLGCRVILFNFGDVGVNL